MKSFVSKIVAAVLVAASLAGCAGIQQESATQWLQHQPMDQE